jgi:hypothetical protein
VDDGLCDSSGQCNCKVNVDGTSLRCGQCRDGYWNLTEHNPDGCQGMNITQLLCLYFYMYTVIVQFVIATWMEVSLPLMDFHSVSRVLGSVFVAMVPLGASVKDAWLVRNVIIYCVNRWSASGSISFACRMGFMTSVQAAFPVNVIRVVLPAKSVIKTL